MALGTHENVSPDVEAQAGTQMLHKMVAADVVGATDEVTVIKTLVKSQIFATDSSHQFSRNVRGDPGDKDCIEIVKNRAVGLIAPIKSLVSSPCNLTANAKVVAKKQIGTKTRV